MARPPAHIPRRPSTAERDDASTVPPPATGGKREANKRATREALRSAAERLFAERGVAGTTVQDIASAAGVTERTFFRYYVSKQDLIMDSGLPWMPPLQDAIRRRPRHEPPLVAMHRVLSALLPSLMRLDTGSPAAMFVDGPPAFNAAVSGRGVMLRVESDLADVFEERLADAAAGGEHGGTRDLRFEAEVLARVALALFRSVMLRHSALELAGVRDRPSVAALLDQAFAVAGQGAELGPPPTTDRPSRQRRRPTPPAD